MSNGIIAGTKLFLNIVFCNVRELETNNGYKLKTGQAFPRWRGSEIPLLIKEGLGEVFRLSNIDELYFIEPPSIPPSQGGRLKAPSFTASGAWE